MGARKNYRGDNYLHSINKLKIDLMKNPHTKVALCTCNFGEKQGDVGKHAIYNITQVTAGLCDFCGYHVQYRTANKIALDLSDFLKLKQGL
jgi:hypothetical protein